MTNETTQSEVIFELMNRLSKEGLLDVEICQNGFFQDDYVYRWSEKRAFCEVTTENEIIITIIPLDAYSLDDVENYLFNSDELDDVCILLKSILCKTK